MGKLIKYSIFLALLFTSVTLPLKEAIRRAPPRSIAAAGDKSGKKFDLDLSLTNSPTINGTIQLSFKSLYQKEMQVYPALRFLLTISKDLLESYNDNKLAVYYGKGRLNQKYIDGWINFSNPSKPLIKGVSNYYFKSPLSTNSIELKEEIVIFHYFTEELILIRVKIPLAEIENLNEEEFYKLLAPKQAEALAIEVEAKRRSGEFRRQREEQQGKK